MMAACIINIENVCIYFVVYLFQNQKQSSTLLVIFCFIDFFPFYILSPPFSDLIRNISLLVCFTAINNNKMTSYQAPFKSASFFFYYCNGTRQIKLNNEIVKF